MQPSPSARSLFSPPVRIAGTTQFLVWTGLGVLAYTRHFLQQAAAGEPIPYWRELFGWLPCYYSWLVLAPAVFLIEARLSASNRSWRARIACLAGVSVVISYAAYLLTMAMAWVVRGIQQVPHVTPDPFWAIPPIELCIEQFLFWSVLTAAYVLRNLRDLRQHEREAAQLLVEKAKLETTLHQAELEALRMRLNPHFLFNSLQNIAMLAQQDPRTASKMMARLGEILRAAFRRDHQPEVPLETELGLTYAYLDVEKMRFGDRLRIELEIAPESQRARVPSFLLQPIVENAIIHGLADVSKDGLIRIRSAVDQGRLVLSVIDNGSGPPAPSLGEVQVGIGLGATRERLRKMYPGAHEIAMQSADDGGTEVRVVLPFHTTETSFAGVPA